MKSPHKIAYEEEGGILGRDRSPRPGPYRCPTCDKHLKKKDIYVANDAGKRWHLHCVMRSEAYHEEFFC